MHLLIPFAFASSEGCAAVLPTLHLPRLQKLLSRLSPEPIDTGEAQSLSPPHERALARAWGLPVRDGCIPLAALQALRTLQPASTHALQGTAWAFVTLVHLQAGAQHVAMGGQALSDLSEHESQALLAAMRPYFEEDGLSLHYEQPTRWLVCGDIFADLATASLDRVAGRSVEPWSLTAPQAAPLRRLQNEMQMLLYRHPVNDERSERALLPVKSFWLSGTGALPDALPQPLPASTATREAQPLVVSALRDAAVCEDWSTWAQGWSQLDANECAALLAVLERGEPAQLTLCGERNAQTYTTRAQPLSQRLTKLFGTQPLSTVLKIL